MNRDAAARKRLGARGEYLAATYLSNHGYRIVQRNYRCEHGEIDIVARQADEWVFIEVKTRSSRTFGLPEEAITPDKAARLLKIAEFFMQEHQHATAAWRVDVVAIEMGSSGDLSRLDHYPNAVSAW